MRPDETTDVKALEDKHLRATADSDALYVVNPGGYVGKSAIFEMGYAVALAKPIFTQEPVEDQTLAAYVDKIIQPKDIEVKKRMTEGLNLPVKPTLPDLQEYIRNMVRERGFDKESPKDVFLLLAEEWGELARAMRKMEGLKMADDTKRAKLGEEMADCLIYLLDLANQYGIDLETAFREKEEKNKKRRWK